VLWAASSSRALYDWAEAGDARHRGSWPNAPENEGRQLAERWTAAALVPSHVAAWREVCQAVRARFATRARVCVSAAIQTPLCAAWSSSCSRQGCWSRQSLKNQSELAATFVWEETLFLTTLIRIARLMV
jgi:hypothetical protein